MANDHYFFALTLSDELKGHLRRVSENIKSNYSFKTWVHYEDYHITLAFLGSTVEQALTDAIEKVTEGLKEFPAFSFQLHEVGTFGRRKAPRILWVNTRQSQQLQKLREIVFNACKRAGFRLESRPFTPHITIARKWLNDDPFDKEALDTYFSTLVTKAMFRASEVALYRTRLHRTPKYEKTISLKLR